MRAMALPSLLQKTSLVVGATYVEAVSRTPGPPQPARWGQETGERLTVGERTHGDADQAQVVQQRLDDG
jgi:hypothetical protein